MGNRNRLKIITGAILAMFFLNFSGEAFAQISDSAKVPFRFAGGVSVTNKGISTVPNLTLGKPAAIFDISAGRGKLSFEPQLRFALEGKPWSFLFWWRYKLLKTDRFQINLGAHPALAFRRKMITIVDHTEEDMVVRRYLAGELAPSILLSKNSSIGLYWLYSRGIEKDLIRNTNLVSVRGSLSNIRLGDKFYLRINPQVYYLVMDGIAGIYFNSTVTLAKKDFPLSISSLVNQPIKTNIEIGNEFLWNVNINYTFGKDYVEK
jgi:hypothetical protein